MVTYKSGAFDLKTSGEHESRKLGRLTPFEALTESSTDLCKRERSTCVSMPLADNRNWGRGGCAASQGLNARARWVGAYVSLRKSNDPRAHTRASRAGKKRQPLITYTCIECMTKRWRWRRNNELARG